MQNDKRKQLYYSDFLKFSRYSLFAAVFVHAIFLVLFFYLGVFPMVIFNTFSVLIYAYCLKIHRISVERSDLKLIGWLVYLEIMSHAVFASYYVGTYSGFNYYIVLLSTLPFLTFGDSNVIRITKSVLIIIVFIVLDIVFTDYVPPYILNEIYLSNLRIFNVSVFITTIVLVPLFFSKVSYDNRKKLEHASTTDELTGLYNRRLFTHIAENELKDTKRNGLLLSIILFDIDNFKTINDSFGHSCGDQALTNLAAILRQTVRPKDILSRWGGEEFIILLPDTDINRAEVVAERLRINVENLKMVCQENKISMTITLGLASNKTNNESLDKLIEQADNAMYLGKTRGKNRYVIAG